LAAIRRKKANLNNKIKDTLADMIHSPAYTKFLQEPIVTMRGDRYVLPVKSECRTSIPGILHDSSSTGATVFIEPSAVVQINNQLRDISIEEEREIERILADFSASVAEDGDNIISNYNIIISLDVLFAKAIFGNKNKCTEPELNDKGFLKLVSARHPLIDKNKVVPIDIMLGENFDTLVVTGPNTGGKTVTLKTVGLLALMCQSGIQLPTEIGTRMPVYENIFADIGDEQSIEQSLSTFSSHMVNIVNILKELTPDSLVLFDELGAGTDPEEGAALAIEILEVVKSFGAKAIATTHYSELKLYALSTDRVENASCEFDVATLRPTYKLLIGVPGKSNAFAISKRLGLPEYIIKKAESRMSAESVKFEDVIGELKTKRDAATAALAENEKMRIETERLRAEIERRSKEINEKRNKILEEARIKAKEIVENAREETSEIIKQVRKLEVSGKNLAEMEALRKKITEKSSDYTDKISKNKAKSNTKASDIRLGMTVRILSLGELGEVVNLPNSNGDFNVQVGIIKVKTNLKDVVPANDENSEKEGQKILIARNRIESKSANIKTELDLRGMLAHDAVMETDKFIDDAALASLKKISVIHGKGTGALRNAIHDYLKNNKLVKGYRLGSFGEGDTGVTIIELK
ncbi:MAG: endonuclease MutS2, partial [Monoglobales bacterium]